MKGQITNKQNRYFSKAQVELTKIEEDLSIKLQELEDKSKSRTFCNLCSNGCNCEECIITTKRCKSKTGDVILELVPSSDKLIVEAKFHPRDLSFIQNRSKAAVKLDAYDYSIYGIFHE